jgi:diguanylate cyclase (GGDEF)-like protein/putative nucleotidyltransferase with HDIG domain
MTLGLLMARMPSFSELYADDGSRAAAIAAVSEPQREIGEALELLWQLYPDRLVEAGYVDVSGAENARVVGGHTIESKSLLKDARDWPSYRQGLSTPVGKAHAGVPFMSPIAGVEVIAVTVPVEVGGEVRAYIELELATSAIGRVLMSHVDEGMALAAIGQDGTPLSQTGSGLPLPIGLPSPGLTSAGSWRYAVSRVPMTVGSGTDLYVVAQALPPSALALVFQPAQAVVLTLALLLLLVGFVSLRRAHREAAALLVAEQRGRAEAELRSRVDVLTGVFNRRHAMETIERELARSGREASSVGLLMFDVDHFKRVNDRHGHAGGDTVLVEVANRLRGAVREWDTVARVGGEEFCVIAPGLQSEAEVAELGDRLRIAIAGRTIQLLDGAQQSVTISAGAALVTASTVSAEQALVAADRALYAAKRSGRNQVYRFSKLDRANVCAEDPECLAIGKALALAGDLREGITGQHSLEVSALAVGIARRLQLSEDEILQVRLGGLLHDVGKISIPKELLIKAPPLSRLEWSMLRNHPVVGAELLSHFAQLAPACAAVRHHHERYDGTGYPDQLAGSQIPLAARIVAVANTFSSMMGVRPYRRQTRQRSEVVDELRRLAGSQLDPDVVTTLLEELADQVPGALRAA